MRFLASIICYWCPVRPICCTASENTSLRHRLYLFLWFRLKTHFVSHFAFRPFLFLTTIDYERYRPVQRSTKITYSLAPSIFSNRFLLECVSSTWRLRGFWVLTRECPLRSARDCVYSVVVVVVVYTNMINVITRSRTASGVSIDDRYCDEVVPQTELRSDRR